MTKLIILTLLSLLLTAGILLFRTSPETRVARSAPAMIKTPQQHRRTPDQTFLTYPEWFLVFSPEEFAAYTHDRPAHQFPFFGHVRQFWQAYGAVNKYIFSRYPFNFGYHVMVLVIGGSTTVEYTLRAAYENVIGRLSYATTGHTFTDEDRFAAKVARDYVDFIKVQPWYEFDFGGKLKQLWKDNPATGKNMIRKWERRYVLSSDYAAKAIYGWLIKKATKASYEEPILSTAVVLDKPMVNPIGASVTADNEVILLPRYDAFKERASELASAGYNFIEIAGNTEVIMVSYVIPASLEFPAANSRILFTQPILTNPMVKRVAVIVPVPHLAQLLRETQRSGIVLEHIYDY